jgi:hypothetical protein
VDGVLLIGSVECLPALIRLEIFITLRAAGKRSSGRYRLEQVKDEESAFISLRESNYYRRDLLDLPFTNSVI